MCNWLFCGKYLSKRSRNRFATFVDTFWLNDGLNLTMFLCLVRLLLLLLTKLYLKSIFLSPLFFNAASYSIFDAWKIFAFDEFLHNLSLIVFGFLYYPKLLVWIFVNIQQCVVRLFIRLIWTIYQVKCHT